MLPLNTNKAKYDNYFQNTQAQNYNYVHKIIEWQRMKLNMGLNLDG